MSIFVYVELLIGLVFRSFGLEVTSARWCWKGKVLECWPSRVVSFGCFELDCHVQFTDLGWTVFSVWQQLAFPCLQLTLTLFGASCAAPFTLHPSHRSLDRSRVETAPVDPGGAFAAAPGDLLELRWRQRALKGGEGSQGSHSALCAGS